MSHIEETETEFKVSEKKAMIEALGLLGFVVTENDSVKFYFGNEKADIVGKILNAKGERISKYDIGFKATPEGNYKLVVDNEFHKAGYPAADLLREKLSHPAAPGINLGRLQQEYGISIARQQAKKLHYNSRRLLRNGNPVVQYYR